MEIQKITASNQSILHSLNNEKKNVKTQDASQKSNKISEYYAPAKADLIIRKNIAFSGNNSFETEVKEKSGHSIEELIPLAQQDENIIGQGANSVVYNIPYLDDYVLKVLNKDDPNKIDMKEFPQEVNLGQPVWQNPDNPRMLILKKIPGQEHSIPNWSKTIWDGDIYAPLPVTKEQAELYFSQINRLADMPQSAFDSIAKDVKMLDDKGYKVDSINPNNLIVDADKKEIHIIDYFKVKPEERHIYQNSCMDLIAVMLDFTLFPEYYDKLNENQKQSALKSVSIISEKMRKGAENSGLSLDDEKFKKYIRTTSRWFTAHSVPKNDNEMYFRYYDVRLDDFINMVENPQKWASSRN